MKEKKNKKTPNHYYKTNINNFQIFPSNIFDILTPEECDLIDKYYIQDWSIKDIAKSLKKSKSTIYRNYNKIIEKIKEHGKY